LEQQISRQCEEDCDADLEPGEKEAETAVHEFTGGEGGMGSQDHEGRHRPQTGEGVAAAADGGP
jgi:hypothetical protein